MLPCFCFVLPQVYVSRCLNNSLYTMKPSICLTCTVLFQYRGKIRGRKHIDTTWLLVLASITVLYTVNTWSYCCLCLPTFYAISKILGLVTTVSKEQAFFLKIFEQFWNKRFRITRKSWRNVYSVLHIEWYTTVAPVSKKSSNHFRISE